MLPGKVKVDIDYIAMKLNMAKSTVSKALNDRPDVSEATKEKVRQFAKRMNYAPNRLAQSLKTRRSGLIGIVMHEMKHEFFVEIARSVTREAQLNGSQAVFASSEGSPENEKALVQDFISRHLDGLIAIPCFGGSHAHLKEVAQEGYPLVIVDNYIEGVDAPFIGTDFEEGGRLAMESLIQSGHKDIGLILGLRELPSTGERLAGCKKALKAAGIAVNPAYVHYGDYSSKSGAGKTALLLERSPEVTAILCANVDLSEGASEALAKMGRRIPGDIALMDFGGGSHPAIDQRNEEIGQTAVQTLFRIINGERLSGKTIIKPRLAL